MKMKKWNCICSYCNHHVIGKASVNTYVVECPCCHEKIDCDGCEPNLYHNQEDDMKKKAALKYRRYVNNKIWKLWVKQWFEKRGL